MTPFGGRTYDFNRDYERLSSALERVKFFADGEWRTLSEWAEIAKCSESAVGARLRDMRKGMCPGYHMKSRPVRKGLWEYRVLRVSETCQLELFRG